MADICAVAGDPVLHSLSPFMHNAGLRALGIDAVYARLAACSAKDALETARTLGIIGLNITSPFKEQMAGLVERGETAKELGAVNTVLLKNGTIAGYNTDIDGVALALRSAGAKMDGAKAVVLGAGGAAKAAVFALLTENAKVTVANRTIQKAHEIAKTFGCESCSLERNELARAVEHAVVVVSCLSTSERVVDPILLHKSMFVLDANYSAETALVKDARAAGCRLVDGKEWLLHQGAKSFEIFFGKKAPLEAMRDALRNAAPSAKNNIALIGMMGSGKNATSHALSKAGKTEVIDTDARIEASAGKKIRDIFENEGRAAFREMESAEISAAVKNKGVIINCGGGAVLKEQNRELLKSSSVVVWLVAKPEIMAHRVAGDDSRPLLHASGKEKVEVLAGILTQRRGLYADAADIIVDTSRKTPHEVAERIAYEVHKAFPHIW